MAPLPTSMSMLLLSLLIYFTALLLLLQPTNAFRQSAWRLLADDGSDTVEENAYGSTRDKFLTPVGFVVQFTTTYEITSSEIIYIQLPHFTRRLSPDITDDNVDLPFGSLIVSPSTLFLAGWEDGTYKYSNSTPYLKSRIKLSPREGRPIPTYTKVLLSVYINNGTGIFCGFPSSKLFDTSYHKSEDKFMIYSSNWPTEWVFDNFPQYGVGCLAYENCNLHGRCDYCFQKCNCDQGYGNAVDVIASKGAIDASCSQRTCPKGKALLDLPDSDGIAHQDFVECSNAGNCDRNTGRCECFPPFSGAACERIDCPNGCSGHGRCMSMRDIAKYYSEINPQYSFSYGTAAAMGTSAWDADIAHGCVCDSSWEVGYNSGQRQLSEWFGPDCSQRRCPSGDDPLTGHDEQNCHRRSQPGAPGGHRGEVGNYCHIDCSNRGICDFETGTCKCFKGFYGENCGLIANQGMDIYTEFAPLRTDLGSAFE